MPTAFQEALREAFRAAFLEHYREAFRETFQETFLGLQEASRKTFRETSREAFQDTFRKAFRETFREAFQIQGSLPGSIRGSLRGSNGTDDSRLQRKLRLRIARTLVSVAVASRLKHGFQTEPVLSHYAIALPGHKDTMAPSKLFVSKVFRFGFLAKGFQGVFGNLL